MDKEMNESPEREMQEGESRLTPTPPTARAGKLRIVPQVLLGVAVAQLVMLVAIAATLWSGITVTVANPVETVKVSDITSVVQVAVPTRADLYGFCYEQGSGYTLSITAVTGGLAQIVAEGKYTAAAASAIGLYAAHYYGASDLDFGDQSEDCSQLAGWR